VDSPGGNPGLKGVRRTPAARPTLPLKEVSTARKKNILLAAEKLFALQSFKAVTMREIAREAGLSLALASYHFGSKTELLHAIFEHRDSYIHDRLVALDKARADKRNPGALEEIVEALVGRALALRAQPESEYFMRLVARQVIGGGDEEAQDIVKTRFDPLAHAFIDAIHELFPRAPRANAAACYTFALGALLNVAGDDRLTRLSRGMISIRETAQIQALLVPFIAAGIRHALAVQPRATKSSASPGLSRTRRNA
jgi:AcrR family transcriptional regulator